MPDEACDGWNVALNYQLNCWCAWLSKGTILYEKLKSLAIPSHISMESLRDIFGYKGGTVMHCRLIDADCSDEFDALLHSLQKTCNKCEVPNVPRESSPQIHDWFVNEKAHDFKECMMPDVRRRNGLGNPPAFYCINDNEAANKVLNDQVCIKSCNCQRL